MTARIWIGVITFVAGALLWAASRQADAPLARRRLALGVAWLGLATLASTQNGVEWSIAAIGFSAAAIVVLIRVLRDSIKR